MAWACRTAWTQESPGTSPVASICAFSDADPMEERDELLNEQHRLEQVLLQAEREGRAHDMALLERLREVNERLARLREEQRK